MGYILRKRENTNRLEVIVRADILHWSRATFLWPYRAYSRCCHWTCCRRPWCTHEAYLQINPVRHENHYCDYFEKFYSLTATWRFYSNSCGLSPEDIPKPKVNLQQATFLCPYRAYSRCCHWTCCRRPWCTHEAYLQIHPVRHENDYWDYFWKILFPNFNLAFLQQFLRAISSRYSQTKC